LRLLLDEMLPVTIAEGLRARGRDVDAVVEERELRGLGDLELFERAQDDGRAIVTYNRDDFLALDRRYRAAGREHHGIVVLNPRRFPQGEPSIGPSITALDAFVSAREPYPGFVHWLQ
jgi:Domain of unknown function (DUF5615)